MKTHSGYFAFILIVLAILGSCASDPTAPSKTAEAAFESAEKLAKAGRYEEALIKYNEVKNKHPYSPYATRAELRIADLHFEREAFIEAQSAYQLFREMHPKHEQIDYVIFQIGMSHFKQLPPTIDRDLNSAPRAIEAFEELLKSHPSSKYAKSARENRDKALKMLAEREMYVADFYFKKGEFLSALGRYEGLLRRYPGLGFDAQALYKGAVSAKNLGENKKAQDLVARLHAQHPDSEQSKKAKDEF